MILYFYMFIFIVAFFLRFNGVAYALPYISHPDEPNFYALANDWRGVRDAGWREDWLAGYPPGYILFYGLSLNVIDSISQNNIHTDMARYVGIMRIVNISLDMLCLALMGLAARWLAGHWAALLAMVVYALSRPAVENAAIALPDISVTLWGIACLVLTLQAFRRQSFLWGFLATLAGLLATIFKYPAAPVLIMPALFYLLQLRRHWRRALLPSAVALTSVGLTAYVLLVLNGAVSLSNKEGLNARLYFFDNLRELYRWGDLAQATLGTLGIVLCLMGGLGLASLLYQRRWQALAGVGLALAGGVAALVIIPGYLGDFPAARYPVRYTLPALAPLVVAAAALSVLAFPRLFQRLGTLCVLVAGAALVPATVERLNIWHLRSPFQEAQGWFETNIPSGTHLWMDGVDAFTSLSRYDRGYSGYNDYPAYFAGDYPTVSDAVRQTVQVIYLTEEERARWPRSAGWQSLDEMILLKRIGGTGYNPPNLYVYLNQALPQAQATAFSAGDVRLLLRGYDYVVQDGQVSVESYWQNAGIIPPIDYAHTLYLTPSDNPNQALAQVDGQLGYRRTSTWDDADEILRGASSGLVLPEGLPAGTYHLYLAVYDWRDVTRLSLADGTTAFRLAELRLP